jgi:hypothetical protein
MAVFCWLCRSHIETLHPPTLELAQLLDSASRCCQWMLIPCLIFVVTPDQCSKSAHL